MSWNAKGFDKPLILLDFPAVDDAMRRNAYRPPDDIRPLIADGMGSEEFARKLASAGKIKEACDFLAYAMNRRACVWWSYLCVRQTREEIEAAAREAAAKKGPTPKEARQAANKEYMGELDRLKANNQAFREKLEQLRIDLATKRFTDPADPRTAMQRRMASRYRGRQVEDFEKQFLAARASLPPEVLREADAMVAEAKGKFFAIHGVTFEEAVREVIRQDLCPPQESAEPTAMDIQEAKLQQKIQEIRDSIKEQTSIFPLKIPGLPGKPSKTRVDEAEAAALRWVLAPTDVNAHLAMEAGNAANGTPQGLLALTAFWSGTNLAPPGGKTLVPPPPGLASKGAASTIYMCAMAKGGTLKYDQRYQSYWERGMAVAQGVDTWGARGQVPHPDANQWEGKPGFGRAFAEPAPPPPATP